MIGRTGSNRSAEWYDQGRCMIRLALRSPEMARQRWQRLLDTDGLRGHYDHKTGEWISYH